VTAGVKAASPDDLKAALTGLPDDAKKKLMGVLSSPAKAEASKETAKAEEAPESPKSAAVRLDFQAVKKEAMVAPTPFPPAQAIGA